MSILELRATFSGKVQNVFFRSYIKKYADQLNIKGFVKNLENFDVFVVAQSNESNLKKFIDLIIKKPGFGKILNQKIEYVKPEKFYENFEIVY
ncbi:MAG: hypothetical protein A2888_01700 [Chlamydiae bacterium RIFCSPLOWO2_01_FULL_28_7]|nr:MAG: hypothetical protein A2888_01700 [Chlamydiae bacterium RIFCSPLOWO2_01_FULL_28_7]